MTTEHNAPAGKQIDALLDEYLSACNRSDVPARDAVRMRLRALAFTAAAQSGAQGLTDEQIDAAWFDTAARDTRAAFDAGARFAETHLRAALNAAPPAAVNPTMTRDELVAAAESIGMRFPEEADTMGGETDCARPAPAADAEPVELEALRTQWNNDGTIETEYKHVSRDKNPPHRWTLYTRPAAPKANPPAGWRPDYAGQVYDGEENRRLAALFRDIPFATPEEVTRATAENGCLLRDREHADYAFQKGVRWAERRISRLHTEAAPKAEEARDAERYRWLKINAEVSFREHQWFHTASGQRIHSTHPISTELDAAIDAAMRVGAAPSSDVARDAERLDWLLPNLHPANFGMEFPGGYEWADEAEFLSKWREAIDAAMKAGKA